MNDRAIPPDLGTGITGTQKGFVQRLFGPQLASDLQVKYPLYLGELTQSMITVENL